MSPCEGFSQAAKHSRHKFNRTGSTAADLDLSTAGSYRSHGNGLPSPGQRRRGHCVGAQEEDGVKGHAGRVLQGASEKVILPTHALTKVRNRHRAQLQEHRSVPHLCSLPISPSPKDCLKIFGVPSPSIRRKAVCLSGPFLPSSTLSILFFSFEPQVLCESSLHRKDGQRRKQHPKNDYVKKK